MKQKTIREILLNQAGLSPEPRVLIDQATSDIKAIVKGMVPEKVIANLYANKGFEKFNNYKNGFNEAIDLMLKRIEEI